MSAVLKPSASYQQFSINPICGAGGAEITGIDASKPLSAATIVELKRALAEYCVIFLRGQTLTPDDQKNFARHFGPLAQTPFIKPLDGHPEMMRIVREATETKKLNFGGRWHSDMTFSAEPVLGHLPLCARVAHGRRRHHVEQPDAGVRCALAGPAAPARRPHRNAQRQALLRPARHLCR